MEKYEEALNLLKELEEGMTPEALRNLTTEEMCYVIDKMAQIKAKIEMLKENDEEN